MHEDKQLVAVVYREFEKAFDRVPCKLFLKPGHGVSEEAILSWKEFRGRKQRGIGNEL